jgi:putative ABC transport system ATP-binding protein
MADHSKDHGHAPAKPYTRLRQLLQPERREILAVIVFAITVGVLSLATPIAVESLVNTVAFGVLLWPLIVLATVLMICLGLAAAIKATQVYVIELLQRRLFVRVVADYAYRIPKLRLNSFDNKNGPELANRFFDILTLQKSLATLLLDGAALVVSVVVGMVVLAFYHPFLLVFDILLLISIVFILFVLGLGGVRTSLQESHAKYEVAAWFEELLRCLRSFKFSEGQKLAISHADHLASEYVTARRQHFRVVWRQTIFSLGLQVAASTALLGLGGYLVIDRRLNLGQLVAAELIVSLVVTSIAKLGKYAEAYYDLLSSAEKLGLMTDLPLERSGGELLETQPKGMAIEFSGLAVWEDRRSIVPSDWSVAPNERIGIDGPPGSGKSTLFEVLCGLRVPCRGSVRIDGIDLRGLDLEGFRKQVGYVERADIFAGTVKENVQMGRSEITLARIRETLELVGLTKLVHNLPDGLDTVLTSTGSPLSASQVVQLSIARSLVSKPRLLILDGVLDSIDLEECPRLLGRLFDRATPWTLLVVATNAEVMRYCDRVVGTSIPEVVPLISTPQNGANS